MWNECSLEKMAFLSHPFEAKMCFYWLKEFLIHRNEKKPYNFAYNKMGSKIHGFHAAAIFPSLGISIWDTL